MKRKHELLTSVLLALILCLQTYDLFVYAEMARNDPENVSYAAWDGVTKDDIFVGDGYRILYTLADHWDGGYHGKITIENTTEQPIENWSLQFSSQKKIREMWNARILKEENQQYTVKHAVWNQDIPAGGSVSFEYDAVESFIGFPESYNLLLGKTISVDQLDYEIQVQVDLDWESGFNGTIIIHNTSEKEIEDWSLDFDFGYAFGDLWDGVIQKQEGSRYRIHNPGYAQNIAPKQSVRIGFSVHQGSSKNLMENFELFQITQAETNDPPADPPMDTDLIRFDTSGYTYKAEQDLYYTSEFSPLRGQILQMDAVKRLDLEIRDFSGKTIDQREIPLTRDWEVADPVLSYGVHTVIATAERTDGSKSSAQLRLYNANDKNISEDLASDYDYLDLLLQMDTDTDGIPDFWEMEFFESDPLDPMSIQPGVRDGEVDSDEDSLTNEFELQHNLNPLLLSTDMDDLNDREELERYNTDPRENDTDRDGANDSWEVQNGYDPLRFNESFHLNEKVEAGGKVRQVEVDLPEASGEGVHSFEITPCEDMFLNPEMGGYIDTAYDLKIRGEFKSATLTFTLDPKLFEQPDFDPAIYYFNEETQTVEEVENQVRNGNTLTATLSHFSKYIVLERKEADPRLWKYTFTFEIEDKVYEGVDVVFVIDSSETMSLNDETYRRKGITHDFIGKMTQQDRAAIIDFDHETKIYQELTSDKESLHSAVDRVDSMGNKDISKALSDAIQILKHSPDNRKKFIFLLTDGTLVDGDEPYHPQCTEEAKQKKIIIHTIGFEYFFMEALLEQIAADTGGQCCSADDVSTLYAVFENLSSQVDLKKDTDEDGIADFFEKAMANGELRLNTGVPLTAMRCDNSDSDGDGLEDGEEMQIEIIEEPDSSEKNNERIFMQENGLDSRALSSTGSEMFRKEKGKTKTQNARVSARSWGQKKDSDHDGIEDDKDLMPLVAFPYNYLGDEYYKAYAKRRLEEAVRIWPGYYSGKDAKRNKGKFMAKLIVESFGQYQNVKNTVKEEDIRRIRQKQKKGQDLNKDATKDQKKREQAFWDEYCDIMNQGMQDYGSVNESLHYFRNHLNRYPKTWDELKKEYSEKR